MSSPFEFPGPVELPLVGSVIQLIQTTGFSGQHFEKFHKICQKYGNTVFLKAGAMNIGKEFIFNKLRV